MTELTQEMLKESYKPFDVVTDKEGNVGLITEVSIVQNIPTYVVEWLVGRGNRQAWYESEDLIVHCNMFVKIAQSTCHPAGGSERYVPALFNNFNGSQYQ